jgi:hypothetical protein
VSGTKDNDVLGYGLAPARRKRRWQILGSIMLAVVLVAFWFGGREGWRRYQAYRRQRQRELNEQLIESAFMGDLEQINQSIRAGADPNAMRGRTPA